MLHEQAKPFLVIVPGAFHKPVHYEELKKVLSTEYEWRVHCYPLVCCGDADVPIEATPEDDAAAILEKILPLFDDGHEAFIIAHSYGSRVATACLANHTKKNRARLGLAGGFIGAIWIAGFAFPTRGKNIKGTDEALPVGQDGHAVLKDGLISLNPSAKNIFYNDLPPHQQSVAFARLCKFKTNKSETAVPQFVESEIKVPKFYLICELDLALTPTYQEKMVEVGEFDFALRIASGHSPFLSMPHPLAEIINTWCVQVAMSGVTDEDDNDD